MMRRCQVCDNPSGPTVEWLGYWMHENCMPAQWQKDRAEYTRWIERIRP